MRMVATIRVESDDGKLTQESVSSVGVDTRLPGIDPDAAKEDFLAQARGLLTAVGETHIPALYAAVQKQVDAEAQEPEETEEQPSDASRKVTDKLRQIRELRQAAGDPAVAEEAQ